MSTLLCVLFFGSIAGYLFGVILQNRTLRSGIEHLWFVTANKMEVDRTTLVLDLLDEVVDSLFRIDGRPSKRKLVVLALLLNSIYIGGGVLQLFLSASPDFSRVALVGLAIASVLIMTSVAYWWGLIAYAITARYVRRAREQARLLPIAIGGLWICAAFYVVPLGLLFLGRWSRFNSGDAAASFVLEGMFTIFTPPGPLVSAIEGAPPVLLALPASLSPLVPSVIVTAALAVLYNRHTLSLLEATLAKLAHANAPRMIRSASIAIFGIASGLMSYYGIAGQ